MEVPFWIGEREFTEADIELIRITVRRFARFSRQEIAATLCENLPWKAPNGRLKLMPAVNCCPIWSARGRHTASQATGQGSQAQ